MQANIQPISAAEVESQLEYVKRAMAAADDPARAEVLAEQLLAFAHRALLVWNELATLAPDGQKNFYTQALDEATGLYARWMKGSNLTDNPAEAERRALAGLAMLQERPDLRHLHHYAALAILELEEGHPRRDTELTRRCIVDELAWLREQADHGAEVSWVAVGGALQVAYNERYASDEQLLGWEAWVQQTAPQLEPKAALHLWSAVEGFYIELFDRGTNPQWLAEARRVRKLIEALAVDPETRAQSFITAVRLYTHEDDQRPIAELYRQALDSGGLQPHVQRRVATMEARVRSRYGELERVVELLAGRQAEYELDYVTAIRDVDRVDSGERCSEANALLAFAYAGLGRWREAVETIERGKCLRQRRTVALRETPGAAQLLAIEGELYALSRGLAPAQPTPAVEQVRDWFAHGLSPEAQLREAYRELLPQLEHGRTMAPLTLAEIGAGLRDGEAALSLGLWWTGVMMALVVPGRDEPAWTLLRDDVAQPQIVEGLAGGEGSEEAFLLALERGVDAVDPRPALERLLGALDAAIGRPVAAAMRDLKLTRLVVLPHNFLRLAPLWALESWRSLEVRMLPGGFALVDPRMPTIGARALIAANPTLDLPLAASEAALAARRLGAAGLATQVIDGSDATEAALAESLAQASLLHFAGHGIASLTNGSMSALLTQLVWPDTQLAGPEALLALADRGDEKRLTIDQEEGSPRRKIYYEYAKSGTLFAEVEGGEVLLAGELWRVGDILVQGTLRGCGLAFLCACSSGLGAIERLEEASGLPAALQVAGVGCVIGTGWPVADEITLLFADEFYERLLPASAVDATLPVAAAVRGAAEALRTMPRDEAARRALALADTASVTAAKLRLRVFAKRLAQGPALPFAHPFDTGAFFVTGAAHLTLEATA
jgi:CHAT domain-containing protein